MIAEWTKEIPNWEKEYKEMMQGLLTKRQLELLDGGSWTIQVPRRKINSKKED